MTPENGAGTSTTAFAVSTASIGWSTVDRIAGVDMPADDFRLGESFARDPED